MARFAIPGFDLVKLVSAGRVTQVFAAVRLADGCPCALKLPAPGWSDHPDSVRLLRQEAAALTAIHHAHVVRLLDARLSDDPIHLVLQWIPGQSLRDRLRAEYRLDRRTALWIARQLGDAIQAIHHAGFIHGDIKPENVLLTSEQSVTLIDFGLAHRAGEFSESVGASFIFGSADYLAPELVQPPRSDGFAADWFSFGVVLHEMLTGALPFVPRSMSELNDGLIRRAKIDAPAARHWPGRLTALVESLLAPSPSDRPAGPFILHELVASEIAALGQRRAG